MMIKTLLQPAREDMEDSVSIELSLSEARPAFCSILHSASNTIHFRTRQRCCGLSWRGKSSPGTLTFQLGPTASS